MSRLSMSSFERVRNLVLGWILLLCAAMVLAETPPAPVPSEGQPAPAPVPAEGQPAAAGQPPDYVIGPGDTIQVFVWRNPELSVTVPVRPDGKISTPLVEDMVAVGKTSSQLARDVETVLAEYVRSPKVNIIVSSPVSAFSQVRVIGEVRTPQAVAYRAGLTAFDVILQVGGLTDFAAGNRAKIVRKGADGNSTEIRVHLESLVRKGRMNENIALQPGDVLIVPASIF